MAGAPIDSFGVGTKIGVAEDAPALDSVYKLVEYGGDPVCKLSAAKATLPAPKQVWRRRGMTGDVIGLAEERDPPDTESLLTTVMRGGHREGEDSVASAVGRFAADMDALPTELRSLDKPGHYPVDRSEPLKRLAREVRDRIRARELA